MLRFVLILAFVAMLGIVAAAVITSAQAIGKRPIGKDDNTMPATFKRISYVVLVLLLLGLASGFLGAV